MTTLQTFIEKQKEEFDTNFLTKDKTDWKHTDWDNVTVSKDEVYDWHKQSLISFLKMEIELTEEELTKNYTTTYKNAIQDQITHYQQYIKTLEL